jgi:hypothetical protein
MPAAKAVASLSPAKQVAGFIDKFEPALARRVRAARAVLRTRYFPTANELVYDNYNALAIGYSSTERVSDVVLSLAVFAKGVNLYFYYGKALDDPDKLLCGNGNQGRFIRLDDVAQLDDRRVASLIRAGIAFGDTPMPQTGRGSTIVKSISAKQRPRRPALKWRAGKK